MGRRHSGRRPPNDEPSDGGLTWLLIALMVGAIFWLLAIRELIDVVQELTVYFCSTM